MTFDDQAATLDRKGIVGLLASKQQLTKSVDTLTSRNAELQRQVDWFKNQIFGTKSERRFVDPDGRQLALGEWKQPDAPGSAITIAEHHRRTRKPPEYKAEESVLRFDESVPVQEIRLPRPKLDDDHEIISERVTFRLAQQPGVYVVLRESARPPQFLDTSIAGWPKGRDPSVGLEQLQSSWVSGSPVLYIGKAGGKKFKSTLRTRLRAYLSHGAGRRAAHPPHGCAETLHRDGP